MGEDLVASLVATGATAVPAFFAITRARMSRLRRRATGALRPKRRP
jgi:hypothetical protein